LTILPCAFLAARGGAPWRLRRPDPDWTVRLLSFGAPLVPAFILGKVLDVSDRYLIDAIHGTGAVGIYSANYALAALPLELVTLAVSTAAAALVPNTWESEGRVATERLISRITRMFALAAFPVVAMLCTLSRELSEILLSPANAAGSDVIPFVSVGGLLVGLQWIAQRGLQLTHRTGAILRYYVIAGSANVVGNLVLIPRYGYIAAAWTTVGSYALLLGLIWRGSAEAVTMRWNARSLGRIALATATIPIVVIAVRSVLSTASVSRLVIEVAGSGVSYLAMLLLTNELPRDVTDLWRSLRGHEK